MRNPMAALRPPLPDFQPKPRTTALLTIDVQYLDAHPDHGWGRIAQERGVAGDLSWYFGEVTRIIPNIRRLQEACRALGTEVMHVKIASLAADGHDRRRGHRIRGVLVPSNSKEAEILPEVAPRRDEIVLTKTTSSAFNSTLIDRILSDLGIEALIVTGVVTSGCVEMTARDASDIGYWVYLVSDGCAAPTPELQNSALERMDGGMIQVKTTEEILALLREPAVAWV